MNSFPNEPITLSRECDAVVIPTGEEVTLSAGTAGIITQELGGSFTVYIEGSLFRISGSDADAIGKETIKAPNIPTDASEKDIEAVVWQQMKTCYDPEIPINIVDLGLIYECKIEQKENHKFTANIKMTLTAPGCGMGDILMEDVKEKIQIIPAIEVADVELVFDPPWSQTMMSEEAQLEAGLL
tara:strand:- start:1335 stop:1886 length:552 start_codon:yes stop_codon:yes gene_type:complete